MGHPRDFIVTNKRSLRNLSTGRPAKARIDVPENVEVFQYGSQRNNIWDI